MLPDRRVLVGIDRDDRAGLDDAHQMVHAAGNAECEVDRRRDRAAADADLDLAGYAEWAAGNLSRTMRSHLRFGKELEAALAAFPNPPAP